MVSGRFTNSGMTMCKYCKHPTLQKEKCSDYVDASQAKRCTFLKFHEYCDWHEDMACAKKSTPATREDMVAGHFAKARSLYELNQERIQEALEAECGV